jgi:hypothetical protein
MCRDGPVAHLLLHRARQQNTDGFDKSNPNRDVGSFGLLPGNTSSQSACTESNFAPCLPHMYLTCLNSLFHLT